MKEGRIYSTNLYVAAYAFVDYLMAKDIKSTLIGRSEFGLYLRFVKKVHFANE